MTVTSTTFPIEGDYKVLWGSSPKFEDGKSIILKEGYSPRGSMAVVTSFTVPEAPAGLYYVGFIRLGRDDPTIFSFTIVPRLRVQPTSGSPGSNVTVYGSGFPVGDTGSLSLDSNPINVNVTADQNGVFVVNFAIPNAPALDHQLTALSSKLGTNVAPATLVVVPVIIVEPQALPEAGDKVTVSGLGFAASSTVTIKYNNNPLDNPPATDSTGSFSYSFILQQNSENGYKFVATDQVGNTAVMNSTAVAPPQTPSPPSPTPKPAPSPEPSPKPNATLPKPSVIEPKGQSFGLLGSQPVNFIWSQVSATGGVTYILEVADNYNFSAVKPGMRITGLTQTNYTLNLEPGTYFWRVKAVGSSGSESEWANSLYAFDVGSLPGWAIAGGVIIYLVLFYLLVRALLRRRREQQPYDYYRY